MSGPRPAVGTPRPETAGGGSVSTIDALTGLRAVAALVVVLYHLREQLFTLFPPLALLDPWLRFGFLGVDVFFVLSGFIISHNYAHRFATFDRRHYRDYLLARFARIYPVYMVGLLLMAAVVVPLALDPRRFTVLGFLTNLVLVQPVPGIEVWNGPSWSVGCEVAAYILFPLVAAPLLRLRRAVALSLAFLSVVLLVVAVDLLYAADGSFPFVAYFWVRLAVEFPLGALVWAAWRHGVRPHWRWDVVALAAVAAAMVVATYEGQGPRSFVIVGCLAVFVAASASATGAVRTVLSWRPVLWGGRISYSVYVVHYPLLMVMFAALPVADHTGAPAAVRGALLLAHVAVVVAAGAAVHHLVEEPARRCIGRASVARARLRRDVDPPAVGSDDPAHPVPEQTR